VLLLNACLLLLFISLSTESGNFWIHLRMSQSQSESDDKDKVPVLAGDRILASSPLPLTLPTRYCHLVKLYMEKDLAL
jgi:hypothetical protein